MTNSDPQIIELIIDGAPGSGKTYLINNIKDKLHKYYKDNLNLDVAILVNGSKPEENKDELVLQEPDSGEISFIQKRYDPRHCYKKENVETVMFFHKCSSTHEQMTNKWIREHFPHSKIVLNIKERDGPSSSVIFNWTSYKDVVLSPNSKADKDILSWDQICKETKPFIKEWANNLKKEKCVKHFVYLSASPDFILQRVKQRKRMFEADWFSYDLSKSLTDAYNYFYEVDCTREKLSHTIFDLYDPKLTTVGIFNAELEETIEKLVLNHLEKILFTPI